MNDRLYLLIWPDYIDPATLAAFERETGIRVELVIIPSAVELVGRMQRGGKTPDVLTPPSYVVEQLHAERRLAELDRSLLPNMLNLETRFISGRSHDPASHFTIIKDWGTTGFMFRTDKERGSPRSWSDFWDLAERCSGHVTVLDSPGEVIGAALKLRGHSYNASGAAELEQARLDLLRLKKHLLRFETNYRPLLASGEAWLSLGWNGDAMALRADGVPIWYVIPSEGSQIWEDDWAIAAAASNPSGAHAFLDFVMRPEIAAQEARYTHYATGNRAALALLEDGIRNDPATYPSMSITEKLEAGAMLDRLAQRRRKALWDEIRA